MAFKSIIWPTFLIRLLIAIMSIEIAYVYTCVMAQDINNNVFENDSTNQPSNNLTHSIDNSKKDNLPITEEKNFIGKYQFMSIKSNQATLRSGPGPSYKATYIFVQKTEPVKLLAESGHWLKVQDYYGIVGWMHQGLLSKAQYVKAKSQANLYRWLDDKLVARIHPNARCKVSKLKGDKLYLNCNGVSGYANPKNFWGI